MDDLKGCPCCGDPDRTDFENEKCPGCEALKKFAVDFREWQKTRHGAPPEHPRSEGGLTWAWWEVA